jgi:hypothetical protein
VCRNIQITVLIAICCTIWKLRNRACFDKKIINSPVETICFACVFIKYWTGLHPNSNQEMLLAANSGRQNQLEAIDVPMTEANDVNATDSAGTE